MNPTVKRLSVLMTTAFVDMIGFGMVFPLLPYYARRLDAAWEIGAEIDRLLAGQQEVADMLASKETIPR